MRTGKIRDEAGRGGGRGHRAPIARLALLGERCEGRSTEVRVGEPALRLPCTQRGHVIHTRYALELRELLERVKRRTHYAARGEGVGPGMTGG